MLWPLRWAAWAMLRFLLSLRYKLTIVGTEEVLKRPGPYLILPNHPAYSDPPNLLVRTIALTNPVMKGIVPLLGVRLDATGDKARRVLGWNPRSPEEAILASAESLVRLGMVEGHIG